MKRTASVFTLTALSVLSGCSTLDLQNASGLADRLNARVATISQVVHQFCPTIETMSLSAETLACAARANRSTQEGFSTATVAVTNFCRNPPSKSVGEVAASITSGVIAIINARNAGCVR